jgi:hypothetical protein
MRKLALLLLMLAAVPAIRAQDPIRLHSVDVTAKRPGPGRGLVGGLVRDTADFPLDGVELTIPQLRRRMFSKDDGSFRFDSVPKGKYSIRARKFGYAPQVRNIEVDSMGAAVDFALVRTPRALPALVVSAARSGIFGTVADTAYNYVAGAEVHVLGKDLRARTDSNGTFDLPAPEGHYMLAILKEGYVDRLLSVTVPADSGRRVTAFMQPFGAPRPHREAQNVVDLQSRMAWRNRQTTAFYTREDLKKLNIEWVYDAMNLGGSGQYSNACSVILDGGPTTATVGNLTVDDIESIEVYSEARKGGSPTVLRSPKKGGQPVRQASRPAKVPVPFDYVPMTNTNRADVENSDKDCPTAVYIWSR